MHSTPCARPSAVLLALLASLAGYGSAPSARGQQAEPAAAAAADVPLLLAGKKTSRDKVAAQLAAPVLAAVDAWAGAASRLELRIALGRAPDHIVIGRGDDELLAEATQHLDDTFALLDPLVPWAEGRAPKLTVALLFDRKYSRSQDWPRLLAELVERRALIAAAADYLREEPEGLTVRQLPLFLQPTFDLTSDGEFELKNELAHKYAQCLVTVRTGQQPTAILWGLGYLVEQRLFGSSYHFRLREFVWRSSHFDWPRDTRRELESRRKEQRFSLGALATDEEAAGKPQGSQMLVWGALAYLAEVEPARLRELLLELAALHAEVDPTGVAPLYRGDTARTLGTLGKAFDGLDLEALAEWLTADKPEKGKVKDKDKDKDK